MTFAENPNVLNTDGKNNKNGNTLSTGPPFEDRFLHVEMPSRVSYAEGKRRCAALGMQLPEIYHPDRLKELTDLLKKKGISKCFAGLEPDIGDAIYRFVATGLPIWKGTHSEIFHFNGRKSPLPEQVDNLHTKWFYGDDGRLYYKDIVPSIVQSNRLGDPTYRDKETTFAQSLLP